MKCIGPKAKDVEHVRAHRSRKALIEDFVTEGSERADEPAKR